MSQRQYGFRSPIAHRPDGLCAGEFEFGPDWKMVRCAARGAAFMYAAVNQLKTAAIHDPVKASDGAVRVKASAAWRETVMVREVGQTAAICAPFVKIAHKYRGHFPPQSGGVDHCRRLLAPP